MLGGYRDSLTVHVTASANERWEVDVFADGNIEVERFVSDGGVVEAGDDLLESILKGE